eukprot:14051883-Alexandrium_andersonii.AAC.1
MTPVESACAFNRITDARQRVPHRTTGRVARFAAAVREQLRCSLPSGAPCKRQRLSTHHCSKSNCGP